MENPGYIGLSQQIALKAQMDMIANNVANMSTPGYRSQNMVFTEYVSKAGASEPGHESLRKQDPISMVLDYGHYQNTDAGPMEYTGNPLDVAVSGPGYFGVETPEGTMYTRAGKFQINNEGTLVTGNGRAVLDEGGGQITIPEGAQQIKIAKDGSIATEDGELGRLMVKEFTNEQSLEAWGEGLYRTEEEGMEPTISTVEQGMIEGSNVNPVLEMTRMIDVLRTYQRAQKLLQGEHDRQRTMIQRLSRGS